MSVFRVYFDDETTQDGPYIILSQRESHHLLKVRRAREGDGVELFDGKGVVLRTTLKKPGKQARLQLIGREKQGRPSPELTLAISMIKTKAMDLVVRQVAEMGVVGIEPLITEHSEVRLDERQFQEKRERWEALAIEGCKQSHNPYLPEFRGPCELKKWLKRCKDDDRQHWVASLQEPANRKINTAVQNQQHCILIGPEGDFSEQEYDAIAAAGFRPLSLGHYALRSETAVVSAVSRIHAMVLKNA